MPAAQTVNLARLSMVRSPLAGRSFWDLSTVAIHVPHSVTTPENSTLLRFFRGFFAVFGGSDDRK